MTGRPRPGLQPVDRTEQETPAPKLEVLEVRSAVMSGNLRALAVVRVGSVTIHDFRIVQQPGHRAFVQPPQHTWVKDGKVVYGGPVIEFPQVAMAQIQTAVLRAWQATFGEGADGRNVRETS